MIRQGIAFPVMLFVNILLLNFTPLKAQEKCIRKSDVKSIISNNGKVNWESFDTSSTILKNKIGLNDLQGLWVSNESIFLFEGILSSSNDSNSYIFEVRNGRFRQTKSDNFKDLILNENIILPNAKSGWNRWTGFINKITPNEIVISWKDNSNYTRQYYRKAQ